MFTCLTKKQTNYPKMCFIKKSKKFKQDISPLITELTQEFNKKKSRSWHANLRTQHT